MVAEADIQARGRVLIYMAVAALGWFLCRQLSLEWRINPQYSYGWVVPLLALYLVFERWKDRPEPQGPLRVGWVFSVLLLALFAVRVIQEANPDWRFASWLAGAIVVGILWVGLAVAGGKSWWRHFAFATAFILVAIPWPTPVENLLVQSLMRSVAAIGVEALNWMGIAAQQEGNLIRLTGGTLGVDEACSGVRSFQATLMAALFFGELYRLSASRRLLLLLLGPIAALAFNLIRAILLSVAAGTNGIAYVDRWHDPAGYIVLAFTFFTLLALAKTFARQSAAAAARPPLPQGEGRGEGLPQLPNRTLIRASIILLAWLAFSEVATAAWYRWHESSGQKQIRWKAEWPRDNPAFAPVKISEDIHLVLRFNEGDAAIWNRPDGSRWHLFFFSWKPGRAAANLARNHRPETCLPATGFELLETRGIKMHHANGIDLPIERLEFAKRMTPTLNEATLGPRLYVYYCLWEDQTSAATTSAPQLLNRQNRIRAALEGRRHLGQRVLEVVIAGIESPERADEEFAKQLPNWVKLEP